MRTFEDASYLERFGVELVRYRYHFQLTQDEMAEKCHLTRFVIIGLEKGRSKLDFETLAKLYLECNKYLFFMLIYSFYGKHLLEKLPADFPMVSRERLAEWVDGLRKVYPVYGPRYYDREGRRVYKKS